ncbi:hypothetical protein [Ferrimonas gelatinilytica]|uniref:Transporter n=1 Tax=Ferrimonas gelatinilytica TaxID=1255257 RepID=A0ABP9RWK3_9GAMM
MMKQVIGAVLGCAIMVPAAQAAEYDRTFPIWGKEAYERGYDLPLPFGLTISVFDMDQPLIIDEIILTDPVLPLEQLVTIDANLAQQTSTTYTLRGDMWVLPFWNIYAVVGYTDGDSVAPVDVQVNLGPISPAPFSTNFNLEFSGPSYGLGTTLAGGGDNWFGLVDVNFTATSLNILDGKIDAFTATPRVGYRWPLGINEYRLWVGAMYQDVDQVFKGRIASLGLGETINQITPDGRFEVTQHLSDPWNTVVGAMYVYDKKWEVILEGGFGERDSWFLSLGRRF